MPAQPAPSPQKLSAPFPQSSRRQTGTAAVKVPPLSQLQCTSTDRIHSSLSLQCKPAPPTGIGGETTAEEKKDTPNRNSLTPRLQSASMTAATTAAVATPPSMASSYRNNNHRIAQSNRTDQGGCNFGIYKDEENDDDDDEDEDDETTSQGTFRWRQEPNRPIRQPMDDGKGRNSFLYEKEGSKQHTDNLAYTLSTRYPASSDRQPSELTRFSYNDGGADVAEDGGNLGSRHDDDSVVDGDANGQTTLPSSPVSDGRHPSYAQAQHPSDAAQPVAGQAPSGNALVNIPNSYSSPPPPRPNSYSSPPPPRQFTSEISSSVPSSSVGRQGQQSRNNNNDNSSSTSSVWSSLRETVRVNGGDFWSVLTAGARRMASTVRRTGTPPAPAHQQMLLAPVPPGNQHGGCLVHSQQAMGFNQQQPHQQHHHQISHTTHFAEYPVAQDGVVWRAFTGWIGGRLFGNSMSAAPQLVCNCERCRPPGSRSLRTFCFIGGLAMFVVGLLGLFNVGRLITRPVPYAVQLYEVAFGALIMCLESTDNLLLRYWQTNLTRCCFFLTVAAGKGFFYIFLGLLCLMLSGLSLFELIVGVYFLLLGIACVLLHFGMEGALREAGIEIHNPAGPAHYWGATGGSVDPTRYASVVLHAPPGLSSLLTPRSQSP